MNLRVYNTLTKKIEKFSRVNNDFIGIYNCGPSLTKIHTHIGTLNCYLLSDILHRYFKYFGYPVKNIMKVTDVNDAIIDECGRDKEQMGENNEKRLKDFKNELEQMNFLAPILFPRVTENINLIVDYIKILHEKGLTYSSNGSIYMSVNKLKNYGQLVNLDKKMSLIKNAQKRMKGFVMDEKENIYDFCLWKAYKPEVDGNVFWNEDIGKGRPGWHIGCSSISQNCLGETFDFHIAGVSHIFPHHENEIAIAESVTNKKFVNYWLHLDYLLVNGKNMSKKDNTLYTLEQIISKGFNPLVLRYTLIRTHYRKHQNVTWSAMGDSQLILTKFIIFLNKLDFVTENKEYQLEIKEDLDLCEEKIILSIEDDLNMSNALTALINLTKKINKNINLIGAKQANEIKQFILKMDDFVGCIRPLYVQYNQNMNKVILKNNLKELINERLEARKNKNFVKSDEIKKILGSLGLLVIDYTGSPQFYCEFIKFKELNIKQ